MCLLVIPVQWFCRFAGMKPALSGSLGIGGIPTPSAEPVRFISISLRILVMAWHKYRVHLSPQSSGVPPGTQSKSWTTEIYPTAVTIIIMPSHRGPESSRFFTSNSQLPTKNLTIFSSNYYINSEHRARVEPLSPISFKSSTYIMPAYIAMQWQYHGRQKPIILVSEITSCLFHE